MCHLMCQPSVTSTSVKAQKHCISMLHYGICYLWQEIGQTFICKQIANHPTVICCHLSGKPHRHTLCRQKLKSLCNISATSGIGISLFSYSYLQIKAISQRHQNVPTPNCNLIQIGMVVDIK